MPFLSLGNQGDVVSVPDLVEQLVLLLDLGHEVIGRLRQGKQTAWCFITSSVQF